MNPKINPSYSVKNMSLAAAARYLNLSPRTLRQLPVERLVLSGVRKRCGYRFSMADLDDFVKKNTVKM